MKRKLLAIILTLSVIISLLPAAAQATTGETFVATTKSLYLNTIIESTLVYKVLTEDRASGTGTVQVGTGGDGICNAIPVGADMPSIISILKTVKHNDIEYAVTTIGKNAFAGCTPLEVVTLYSIKEISDNAFYDCPNIRSFECLMVKAPFFGNNVFSNAIQSYLELKIPLDDATGYSPAYGWPVNISSSSPIYLGEHYGWLPTCGSYPLSDTASASYYMYEDEIMLCRWRDDLQSDYEIPSEVKGYPVTAIFADNIHLNSLKKLVIPDNIKIISEVYGIGNISSLEEIELTGDNPSFVMEGGVLFNKEKTMLIKYLKTNTAESYTVPDTVTTIAGYAFGDCANLKNITIPDRVKYIGSYAFLNTGITDLRLPDSLKALGKSAIPSNLNSLSIPGDMNVFRDSAFWTNRLIYNVTIRNGKPLHYRKSNLRRPQGDSNVAFNVLKGYKNLIIDDFSSTVLKIHCQYMSPLHQFAIERSIEFCIFDIVPTVNEYSDLLDVEILTDNDIMVTAKCKQGKNFDLSKLKLYKTVYTDDGRLYNVEAATTEMSEDGTLTLTVSQPKSPAFPCKLMLWDGDMQPVTKTMNGVYIGSFSVDPSHDNSSYDLTYLWEFK